MIDDKQITLAAFERIAADNPDQLLELIDGRIAEKVVGREHGRIVLKLGALLIDWCEANGIQGHYGTEVHHMADEQTPLTLLPDVSFAYGGEALPNGAVKGMPDFVVEVKSASNSYQQLRDKARLYLRHGTRLVWLIYPQRAIVEVYYADGSSELFDKDQTLTGEDVLPGFTLQLRDIFNS